ncbi:MAG: hypothetical protein AABZ74_07460 [Cyanobacteriota bacterium]
MTKTSVIFIKTAFIYFLLAHFLGAILLINKAFNFNSKIWFLLPLHINIVFLGWFIQFIFGVAFWILPRYPSYEKDKTILISYFLINFSIFILFLKTSFIIIEFEKKFTDLMQLSSLIILFFGIILFVKHIRKRISLDFLLKKI